jgi:CRISP-associated protein Cas1
VAGAELRAAQYSALADPERALGFARGLLGGKLTAQYQHLSGLLAAARPAQRPALTTALARIDAARRDLERAATLDTVRGHEGTAAAAYWRAIVVLVPPAWGFTARRHHPAPDPFNALLSFGYTLLLQEVVTAATIVGLDVGMGALHPADGARPSLALDLEEPFRPLGVDQWVLAAVRHGDLRSHDFVREGERVLLTPAGRRWYLETYGRAMERRVRHPLAPGRVSVRAALELHARLTARVFQGEAERMGAIEWPDSARS